jgi:hypothetical protein
MCAASRRTLIGVLVGFDRGPSVCVRRLSGGGCGCGLLVQVFAGGWMSVMIVYASDIIRCMLWTSVILNVVACAIGLATTQVRPSGRHPAICRSALAVTCLPPHTR